MRYALSLSFLLLLSVTARAQITSVPGGGNWWEGSAWIGGQVPTATDDVIVDGPISVRGGDTCRDLTVTSNGSLVDAEFNLFTETLEVTGSISNSGALLPGAHGIFAVTVQGDVFSNGSWDANTTTLAGTGSQVLSQGAGATFGGTWLHHNDTGTVSAGSNLAFSNGSLDLEGRTLRIDGFTLTMDETSTVVDGTVAGSFATRGTVQVIGSDLTFEGTITNEGTLDGHPAGLFTDALRVSGTLVNQGTIGGGDRLFIELDGSAVNEGIWAAIDTRFVGTAGQSLSHSGGHPLGGGWSAADSVTVAAAGPLEFESATVDLNQGLLGMSNHTLTLSGGTSLTDGRVDTRDLLMKTGATIGSSFWPGEISLRGAAQAYSGTVFEGPVTVADTLRDAPAGLFIETIEVQGRLRNEGIIEGQLYVRAFGDLVSAGERWEPNTTYLDGTGQQNLYTENGAAFGGQLVHRNDVGPVRAASDVAFRNGTFDLETRTFHIDGFALMMDETATLVDGTLSGDFVTRGVFQVIGQDLNLDGHITNEGLISGHPAGLFTDALHVRGQLTNRGTIGGDSARLYLELDGQASNEGTWSNFETRFVGLIGQTLSHLADSPLGGGWTAADSVAVLAGSALAFDSASVDLNQGLLEMGEHALTLRRTTNLTDARVDARTLTMTGGATTGSSRWLDEISLHGNVQVYSGTVFEGPVTVVDTLRDAPFGSFTETVEVERLLRNRGVILGQLDVLGHGNLQNDGEWANSRTLLVGSGRRTIRGAEIASPLEVAGEDVVLVGDVELTRLVIRSDATARLAGLGTLRIPTGGLAGTVSNFVNSGRLIVSGAYSGGSRVEYFDASVTFPSEAPYDSLVVTTFGNQVPETYGSAIQNWWRLEPNASDAGTLPELAFRYADGQLGLNVEADLKVFHSTDEAVTWTQISTSENLSVDAESNSVTLQNAPASGDFVVSSETDPVSVIPNIVFSITGRPNIRIGAPNRYVVSYVNGGNQPSGDMFVALALDPGGHIDRIEQIDENGNVTAFRAEDFVVTDVNGDNLAMLYISGLDPGEEGTFYVIATADITVGKQELSLLWFAIGAVTVLGGPLIISAILETGSNACDEFRGQIVSGREPEVFEAFQNAFERTADRFTDPVKVWWTVVGNFVEALVERGLGVFENTAEVAKTIFECGQDAFEVIGGSIVRNTHLSEWQPAMERIRCGAERAREALRNRKTADYTAGGAFCPAVYGTSVGLPAVRSWDPNEKTGPYGLGVEGFVTSAGKMDYTILFENKAEATAEAYRIVIHDTLTSVFDAETVELGATSHPGFVGERTDNVLRWEIEGIELPPNVDPPEGEGFVSFSVNTANGLPSGTAITNRATIVFDANPPITTNEVTNTLDYVAPTTVMQPLQSSVEGSEVVVRWEAADGEAGSGVGTVNVYQSVDGSGFVLVGSTIEDSLAVDIANDGRYSYYALAVDRVGNAESTRPTPVETFVTFVGTEEGDEVPFAFDLHQNYPNPFNPSTTMRYEVPAVGDTKLQVFDITGRLVATLVSSIQAAGRYEVNWNAVDKASGVYFFRLTQGDRVEVRPMVLVK